MAEIISASFNQLVENHVNTDLMNDVGKAINKRGSSTMAEVHFSLVTLVIDDIVNHAGDIGSMSVQILALQSFMNQMAANLMVKREQVGSQH